MPRNWMDSNLPRCPFCKTPSPWEMSLEKNKPNSWGRIFGEIPQKWYKAYHFRCPKCLAILSVPANAVISMPVMYDGSILPGLVKLVQQIEAKKEEKVWNRMFLIESVGINHNLQHLVGSEYPLEVLQDWARQIGEGKKK